MTYRELLGYLESLNDQQLDSTVTIHDAEDDEYFPAVDLYVAAEQTHDQLDHDHPYISIKEPLES